MAMSDVIMNYVDQADLLVLRLPVQEERVKGSTAILPFDPDEDAVPATSLVLFVGYDEESGDITGELVGLEIPFFSTFYPTLRMALRERVKRAMPPRFFDGRNVSLSIEDVNPGAIDPDIKNDRVARNFTLDILTWLDDFYNRVQRYKADNVVPPGIEDVSERRPTLRVTMQLIVEGQDQGTVNP
jgi:hypothetical protein